MTAEPLVEALEYALCPYPNVLADNHARYCVGLSHSHHEERVGDFLTKLERHSPALAARMRAAEPDTVTVRVEDVARRLREWPRRNGGNHEAEARRLLGLTGEGGG